METITQDDVIRILKMLEESDFDELHLEMDGLKLIANKKALKTRQVRAAKPQYEQPEAIPVAERPEPVKSAQEAHVVKPADIEEEGLTAIKAPMLGTFYKAPKPGAPPFVEEGQLVGEDDTVCIIEVMKLFNTIKARVRGRIKKICAENGQMVEFQQTLFLVDESESGEKQEAHG